jgi:hypothetical protein
MPGVNGTATKSLQKNKLRLFLCREMDINEDERTAEEKLSSHNEKTSSR